MREVLPYTTDPKIVDRFWAKVLTGPPEDCWEWQWANGATRPAYGEMRVGKERFLIGAHRFAYALHFAEDPGDKLVCHTCDNRRCCNPKHLFLGTIKDNSLDMVAKGRDRQAPSAGEQNGNAKLTGHDVLTIHEMFRLGYTNVRLAALFGVTHQAISKIRRGHYWKRVTNA